MHGVAQNAGLDGGVTVHNGPYGFGIVDEDADAGQAGPVADRADDRHEPVRLQAHVATAVLPDDLLGAVHAVLVGGAQYHHRVGIRLAQPVAHHLVGVGRRHRLLPPVVRPDLQAAVGDPPDGTHLRQLQSMAVGDV